MYYNFSKRIKYYPMNLHQSHYESIVDKSLTVFYETH